MANLQHHKSIAVRAPASTRSFRLDQLHVARLLRAVEQRRGRQQQEGRRRLLQGLRRTTSRPRNADDFRKSKSSAAGTCSASTASTAKVGYSPHTKKNGLLADVGKDIAKAKSSVLFSLAFLGQMKNGPIGPALGKQIKSKNVHTLGIADARVKEGNLGVDRPQSRQQATGRAFVRADAERARAFQQRALRSVRTQGAASRNSHAPQVRRHRFRHRRMRASISARTTFQSPPTAITVRTWSWSRTGPWQRAT